MKARLRKAAVVGHIIASVGWLGAVAAFLALAIAGFTSPRVNIAEATAVAMELVTWLVIVPFAVASLLSGVLVSMSSPWGLLRHYWVVAKLLITVGATGLLLLHTQPIGLLSAAASQGAPGTEIHRLQVQLIGDASAALLVLVINVLLSVFKPWGPTRLGAREKLVTLENSPRSAPVAQSSSQPTASAPRWVYIVGFHALGIGLLLLVAHLVGDGASLH